jgi:parvulin-like peptidyl-prolyl isomerase
VSLIAKLKHATREQFAEAAREHSIDPASRSQGGELGYFDEQGNTEKGQPAHALPPLTKAAFTLKRVGDVTPEPVALPNGFALLMLTAEMPPFAAPAGQVDETVREQLVAEKQAAAVEALVAGLRNQAQPVVHAELLDRIVLPEAQPLGIPEGFPAAPPDPRESPKLIAPDRY